MYVIEGKYKGKDWEELDTANTEGEAKYLMDEYMLAFGSSKWSFRVRRDG